MLQGDEPESADGMSDRPEQFLKRSREQKGTQLNAASRRPESWRSGMFGPGRGADVGAGSPWAAACAPSVPTTAALNVDPLICGGHIDRRHLRGRGAYVSFPKNFAS